MQLCYVIHCKSGGRKGRGRIILFLYDRKRERKNWASEESSQGKKPLHLWHGCTDRYSHMGKRINLSPWLILPPPLSLSSIFGVWMMPGRRERIGRAGEWTVVGAEWLTQHHSCCQIGGERSHSLPTLFPSHFFLSLHRGREEACYSPYRTRIELEARKAWWNSRRDCMCSQWRVERREIGKISVRNGFNW